MPDRSQAGGRRWLWKNAKRRCAYCGKRLQKRGKHALTADHVIPLSAGGTNKRTNLTPACRKCNMAKSSTSAVEFKARLADTTAAAS